MNIPKFFNKSELFLETNIPHFKVSYVDLN